MNRQVERIAWVGVALLALGIGLGTGKSSLSSSGKPSAQPANTRHATRLDFQQAQGEGRPPVSRDAKELRQRLNGTLLTEDNIERLQKLSWILDEVTPENWQTLWEEYLQQTMSTGRVHETEWQMFMNRVGEVAGADAIKYFESNAQNQYTFNRRGILYGWAGKDPEGAAQWMLAQAPDSPNQSLWSPFIHAVAGTNPDKAIALVSKLDPRAQQRLAEPMIDSMIQLDGIQGATRRLEQLVSQIPEGEAPSPLLKSYFGELQQRVGRMNWLADSYPDQTNGAPDLSALEAFFGEQ